MKKIKKKKTNQVEYWDSFARLIMETIESRHAQGMAQETLAQSMSTKQSVISRFENMGRLPSYDFIARLSIALGHSPGMTLYGEYMTVVPLAKQNLVKDRASFEGLSTQAFVERIVDRAITLYEPQELRWQTYNTSAISSTTWGPVGIAPTHGAQAWVATRMTGTATIAYQSDVFRGAAHGRVAGC